MKLHKYDEFINESQLQLLLEATITYSDDFTDILTKVNSPIAKHLLDVRGKEVDINQNYIDINKDKTDVLSFKPDDKVEKAAKILSPYTCYYSLSKEIETNGLELEGITIKNAEIPVEGQTGEIVGTFTREKLDELGYGGFREDLLLFQWRKGSKVNQALFPKRGLSFGVEAVKSSDISVGRLVRAILKKSEIKFTDAEIEEFVYKYRAEVEKAKDALNARFNVVKGTDIVKYYNARTYEKESGSLGNSCMRYDRCSSYLKIYEANSQVSLLIFKSEEDTEKIIGRAILWEIDKSCVDEGQSNKVMDRIYTIYNSDEELFKQWAIQNDYWYKKKQDFNEDTPFVYHSKNGDVIEVESQFYVKLDRSGYYSEYPYIDTFKFYNVSDGILSNDHNSEYDYTLNDTDGGDGSCSNCGGNGTVECSRCDGNGECSCSDCRGSGREECSSCDGRGKEECSRCDGYGEVDCSTCDGSGEEECYNCGGSGEVDDEECSDCNGNGKKDCSDCNGNGKEQCTRCDGDGNVDCSNCDGNGDYDCGNCDGSGEMECPDCDGRGREDCYNCS